MECIECYSENNRITPLLEPRNCLENHEQYICGTCGRCICINKDDKRNLQRWNFPFKSIEITKLYLRTADFTVKSSCGIYEIQNKKGGNSYKIFKDNMDLNIYLQKNKDKKCALMNPVYMKDKFIDFENTQVRMLTKEEAEKYLTEQ